MRVLLDANILISYLLADEDSAIVSIVRAGVLGQFTLLLPEELLEEIARKAPNKPYLVGKISPESIAQLAAILTDVAETIPRITDMIPAVTRDPKDDYLLAYSLVGQADFLVTGDRDLLALGQVGDTKIIAVREFWDLFNRR